jgi:hypothetical protein
VAPTSPILSCNESIIYSMSLQYFYGKGPHPLLCAGSLDARGKITVSGIRNRLKYCVICVVYTQFKCGRGPHNTTWRAASWRPTICSVIDGVFYEILQGEGKEMCIIENCLL